MKCPKCHYLGFETGDRCRNCGYDFSLATPAPAPAESAIDLTLRAAEPALAASPGWADSAALHHPDAALPLFTKTPDEDPDEPLIKLPAAPRRPLAVRKTPAVPRLRAVPRPMMREPEPEPELSFEEPAAPESPVIDAPREGATVVAGAPGARAGAAALDHTILFGVDAIVIYLTVRMAGLSMADWTALPLLPLIMFLLLLKVAYFSAFTAVGGQTIGKMASHLRVVMEDGMPVDVTTAFRRTVAGAVSTVALGLGYLPAFMTADRRALHDRIAATRVVSYPSV